LLERALVSVVIPTRGRPQWVVCAVTSALIQSYLCLEVIVVVDGPDPETVGALRGIDDERLRLIELTEPVGGSEARNVGVRAAGGEVRELSGENTPMTWCCGVASGKQG